MTNHAIAKICKMLFFGVCFLFNFLKWSAVDDKSCYCQLIVYVKNVTQCQKKVIQC